MASMRNSRLIGGVDKMVCSFANLFLNESYLASKNWNICWIQSW